MRILPAEPGQAGWWFGTLSGFAAGFCAIFVGVLGFDVAFILGFVEHGSEVTTGAILVASAMLAIASWVLSVYFGRFLAWLCGSLVCAVAMYSGLWSLTGSAAQTILL
jgi:hypothetical protein